MYSTTSFYIAKIFVATVRYMFYPFFLTMFSVWFYGMPLTAVTVLSWWGTLTIVALVFSAFGFMLGCMFPYNSRIAPVAGECFFSLMGIGAGFVFSQDSSNFICKFIGWTSPMHYACELMLRIVLQNRSEVMQTEILDYFGYTYGVVNCVFILIGFWFFFILLGWVLLILRG